MAETCGPTRAEVRCPPAVRGGNALAERLFDRAAEATADSTPPGASAVPAAEMMLVFVSMFAPTGQGGIRAYHLDPASGAVSAPRSTANVPHPFFLAVHPDRRTLYSIRAEKFGSPDREEVVAWRIVDFDGRLDEIGRQPSHGSASCYLDVDPTGRSLLMAGYSSGNVASFPIESDGRLGLAVSLIAHRGSGPDEKRQDKPHAHSIIAVPTAKAGMLAYAADLGTDQVLCYHLDPAAARLTPADPPSASTPPGAGPRHLALHPDGKSLYAVNELANTVTVFDRDVDTGRLTAGPTVSTLPADFTGTSHCADVKLTPDGRFLYATNRGHDSIAIFRVGDRGRLERLAITPSLGAGPQNLAITPDGGLLLCANMPGDNLVVFRIDRGTGSLAVVGEPLAVEGPACIQLIGRASFDARPAGVKPVP